MQINSRSCCKWREAKGRRRASKFLAVGWLLAVFAAARAPSARAKDSDGPWLPIDPADLAMKSEPLASGAPAIYLYREIASDDTESHADYYYRIKILTEEGKNWGNVELPYIHDSDNISLISGRTIQPDGTIIPWQGKALDQTVLRAHGVKVLEKSFRMPDVQVGSIIEYRFRISWASDLLLGTTWTVTADLFTRQLHCTMKPYVGLYGMIMQAQRVPPTAGPTREKDKLVHYDAQNIPGIETEDFMPPTDAIIGRVDFYYTINQTTDVNKYWQTAGQDWNNGAEKFIGHSSGIYDESGKVAPASDPPETRLRKLYARAQQIRDLSREQEKTEDETKDEKLKDNNNADDVLKNGYGYDFEVNLFFIALARAAGFEASSVRISDRARYFFNPNILDQRQMDTDVVLVKLDGQDLFLDPASAHCGFGELPWPEAGARGLKLDAQGGSFVDTTAPKSSDAIIERTATLQMGDDKWLQGKLVVTFSGQDAMRLRQDADDQDDADRKKTLIDKVTTWLPAGATITLTNQPDWAGSDLPLRAEFDVRTKTVGATTGHFVLMSEDLFSDADLPRFDHPQRTYPIYFDYPWVFRDDIMLTLPVALEVGNLPAPVDNATPFGHYELSCTKQPGALHFERIITLPAFFYSVQYYGPLRAFFDEARHADQQQVMLQVAGTQGTQARQ
jgi:hypothetical protein